MKRTPQVRSSEQTTSPSPVIKNYFPRKIKYSCNCLKHQNNQNKYFHNFEVGSRVLEFRQHDGKMYNKIQKDISKNYSGTGPRVYFWYIFLNFIIHFTIVLSKFQDTYTNLEIVKIFFLIILMFQAITSIFHFFLENSFLLLGWDW